MKTIQLLLVWGISLSALVAAPEDSAHHKAAERLLALINSRDLMISAFMATTQPMLAQVSEDQKEAVRDALQRFAVSIADAPELKEKMTAIYEEAFTESELNELIAFYSTPVGKKALTEMPALFQKGAIVGQKIAEQKRAAFQAEIEAILKGTEDDKAEDAAPADSDGQGTDVKGNESAD